MNVRAPTFYGQEQGVYSHPKSWTGDQMRPDFKISDVSRPDVCDLAVIIPAYNEAESIADTVRSLQCQTLQPAEIIVVDDCSTDGTGDFARKCGVTVLRPDTNTGTKAGAQNLALKQVRTTYTMAVDGDTTLAPDAVELLMKAFDGGDVAAACGFVVPRHVSTLWERGRYIEYLFAFTFYKPIQDYYEKPLISSGCFSVYDTRILKANGGWSTRTMAEDMDLTWSFYQDGHAVRFIPEAVCYPIEPHTFNFMRKQLKRWSHGFIQNVQLHWRGVLKIEYLRTLVGLALWDATVASVAFLVAIPLLAIFVSPLFLIGYVVDVPAVLVPVLIKAKQRNEVGKALASFPAFLVLRFVNAIFFLKAFTKEMLLGQRLNVYEKGH
jgi:biofilm PGA synthesis N-glycosyltransferase PgaC